MNLKKVDTLDLTFLQKTYFVTKGGPFQSASRSHFVHGKVIFLSPKRDFFIQVMKIF